MELENLIVKPLHKCPQYLTKCCNLLNEEWPRSQTARMMSLQASSDKLPTSLILLSGDNLLGHCKLTPILSLPNSCFIEAVVIKKSMRGRKLGTHLMTYVEKYCKHVLKLEMIHLSTKGQEQFYAKLGYEICPPISIYGNCVSNITATLISDKKKESTNPTIRAIRTGNDAGSNAPPPPPPPKPQPITTSTIKTSKTYMCKYLVEERKARTKITQKN